jgi:hypothetical protein
LCCAELRAAVFLLPSSGGFFTTSSIIYAFKYCI